MIANVLKSWAFPVNPYLISVIARAVAFLCHAWTEASYTPFFVSTVQVEITIFALITAGTIHTRLEDREKNKNWIMIPQGFILGPIIQVHIYVYPPRFYLGPILNIFGIIPMCILGTKIITLSNKHTITPTNI